MGGSGWFYRVLKVTEKDLDLGDFSVLLYRVTLMDYRYSYCTELRAHTHIHMLVEEHQSSSIPSSFTHPRAAHNRLTHTYHSEDTSNLPLSLTESVSRPSWNDT